MILLLVISLLASGQYQYNEGKYQTLAECQQKRDDVARWAVTQTDIILISKCGTTADVLELQMFTKEDPIKKTGAPTT